MSLEITCIHQFPEAEGTSPTQFPSYDSFSVKRVVGSSKVMIISKLSKFQSFSFPTLFTVKLT